MEKIILNDDKERYQCPVQTYKFILEVNFPNILKTIPIDMSINTGIIQKYHYSFQFLLGGDHAIYHTIQRVSLFIFLVIRINVEHQS